MKKQIYDEKNGLWYELHGDYYLPCLTVPLEEKRLIGVWGQRHLRYLRQYRKALHTELQTSLSGKLIRLPHYPVLSSIIHYFQKVCNLL